MKNWADDLYAFYTNLRPVNDLPNNIEWLLPYQQKQVQDALQQFLLKFYNDRHKRKLLLGINPGRFGAGITGINFTAPRQLLDHCKMDHSFGNKSELSAEFVYAVIQAYGGVQKFYGDFFIGSVCPLGFVQQGKNLNYYDDKELLKMVEPFIIDSISRFASLNIDHSNCICIGGEKNFRYLSTFNNQHKWFKEIVTLPHPRFIMQYKRKNLEDYVKLYLQVLKK